MFRTSIKEINQAILHKPLHWLFWILLANFILRLIVFYNTTLFSFYDYKIYLDSIESIKSGEKVFLQTGAFQFAISYIGYFAKYILGSLDLFFIFNCFLGTLASFISYLICIELFKDARIGILSILFQTVYTENIVFSSIFYTPVMMLFLLNLIIYLIINYFKAQLLLKSVLSVFGIIIIIVFSLFLKPELKYLYIVFFIAASIFLYRRMPLLFKKSILLGILLLLTVLIFDFSDPISKPKDNIIPNDFVFWGHTDYGGAGGEGAFIYEKNKERYDLKYQSYLAEHNIEESTMKSINAFQKQEIIQFISQQPFRWIALQFKKLTRTYGIIPEGNSFSLLYTGLLKGKTLLSIVATTLPIFLFIMLLMLSFQFPALKSLLEQNSLAIILMILFLYYLFGTTFLGAYQERYRLPVIFTFILPVISYFIININYQKYITRRNLIVRVCGVFLVLGIWLHQGIWAVKTQKDRLYKAQQIVNIH
jgi:hypothetical protein